MTLQDHLYSDALLKFAAGLQKKTVLSDPDFTATADSPLCGSRIRVDINYQRDQQIVTAYGHDVRACALGQASAAILQQHIIGQSKTSITAAYQQLLMILKESDSDLHHHTDPHPNPDSMDLWKDLALFRPVAAHRSRHASVLLPFKAVLKAIDQSENDT